MQSRNARCQAVRIVVVVSMIRLLGSRVHGPGLLTQPLAHFVCPAPCRALGCLSRSLLVVRDSSVAHAGVSGLLRCYRPALAGLLRPARLSEIECSQTS